METESSHTCDCGASFDTSKGLRAHQSHPGNPCETSRVRQVVEDKLDSEESPYHVYTIRVRRQTDGQEFYYVGMSTNVGHRIVNHNRDSGRVFLPTQDGAMEKQPVEFVGLLDVKPAPSRGRAENLERREMLRVAREKETDKVAGGR